MRILNRPIFSSSDPSSPSHLHDVLSRASQRLSASALRQAASLVTHPAFRTPAVLRSSSELILGSPVGPTTRFNDRDYLFFGGTGYLGLAENPFVRMVSAAATLKYGTSMSASRVTTGTHRLHLKLERALAKFMGTEDAIICGSGGKANEIMLAAIASPDDVIICDSMAHPSLVSAVPHGNKKVTFTNGNLDELKELLAGVENGIVVVNGVDAVTGEVAPLDRIMAAIPPCKNIRLLVDDCHGIFVLGENGRGSLEHFGFTTDQIYQTATMSKAQGSYGGMIAGSNELCLKLRNTAVYRGSTGLPPGVTAASLASTILMLTNGHELRTRLHEISEYAFQKFSQAGFQTNYFGTPILSLQLPVGIDGQWLSSKLREEGIYLPYIHYPYPHSPGTLRLALSAGHTKEDIDRLYGLLIRLKQGI